MLEWRERALLDGVLPGTKFFYLLFNILHSYFIILLANLFSRPLDNIHHIKKWKVFYWLTYPVQFKITFISVPKKISRILIFAQLLQTKMDMCMWKVFIHFQWKLKKELFLSCFFCCTFCWQYLQYCSAQRISETSTIWSSVQTLCHIKWMGVNLSLLASCLRLLIPPIQFKFKKIYIYMYTYWLSFYYIISISTSIFFFLPMTLFPNLSVTSLA